MDAEPKRGNLTVTRVFDAPIDQVWSAWAVPDLVMQWWGPAGFTCPVARMDFREGGTSLVCMRAPKEFGGQDMFNTWTYETIVPMERFVYTLRFADRDGNIVGPAGHGLPPEMPEEVRHEVVLEQLDTNRTRGTVTEYDWPIGPTMEMSRLGLEQCLDKMAALFSRPAAG